MKYREMPADDYDSILDLSRRIDGIRFTEHETRDWHTSFLQRNPGMSFVAEAGSSVVGFVYCGSDGRRATVYHLAIAASQRGNGIGRRLMCLVEDAIRSRGISRGLLLVFATNDGAVKFYERLGWQRRDDLLARTKDMHTSAPQNSGASDAHGTSDL